MKILTDNQVKKITAALDAIYEDVEGRQARYRTCFHDLAKVKITDIREILEDADTVDLAINSGNKSSEASK